MLDVCRMYGDCLQMYVEITQIELLFNLSFNLYHPIDVK